MKINKMDRIWVATASLLFPKTKNVELVSLAEIVAKINQMFPIQITPIMVTHHLVSWKDRQADKNYPKRGGSRNRYLFQTLDGLSPSANGLFRLYKKTDAVYDGWDKTGKVHPEINSIPKEYWYLLDWYPKAYFEG